MTEKWTCPTDALIVRRAKPLPAPIGDDDEVTAPGCWLTKGSGRREDAAAFRLSARNGSAPHAAVLKHT